MSRLLTAVLVVLLALSCAPDPQTVHRDAIVCDMHCDTLMRVLTGYELGQRNVEGHVDIPRLREGGVDLEFFACWPNPSYLPRGDGDPDSSAYIVYQMIDAFYKQLDANRDAMGLALTADQAMKAISDGKIAAALAVEGGHAIENDLGILEDFYNKGVRYMTLTWNNSNDWADASGQVAEEGPLHGGLTEFGKEVVRTMNRLGMMVDVSHVAESTFWDVIHTSEDPVIASHSCAYSLCPHYRNLKDDQLRALAANGGVACVNFYSGYLDSAYARVMEEVPRTHKAQFDSLAELFGDDQRLLRRAQRQVYGRALRDVHVPLDRLIDHIDYVAHVAGIDHVGLGSDFDGITAMPDGISDVSDMPKITKLLLDRGYSPTEVKKILGGNFLRVFAQVCGRNRA
jgi:membrane dipeptidase